MTRTWKRPWAVLMDRDGVINRDSPDYIKTWDEFSFLPGSLAAFRRLRTAGIPVIIITNQSAAGRGYISEATLRHIHGRMRETVRAAGGRILDIFYCPHTPEQGCGCRKPAPGLLFQAARRHGLDLSRCLMIGDSARDIESARRAGCGQEILVKTGNGTAAETQLIEKGCPPAVAAENLREATDFLLSLPPAPRRPEFPAELPRSARY
ncbi:MAG: D-glycero-beta-D-manno-heptose-1,7-bisphosphate 7-phosphatase [Desulfobacterales bacterium]|nr:MAG: D-glycero-beta-D-manno-heptose-1,7-bisphosphate 7-phosphatase [Desulfobacterales bacterium]